MPHATFPSELNFFSVEDVAKHNIASDCWIIHRGKVYNVTDFVQDHPGGNDLILQYAGKDLNGSMEDYQTHSHSGNAYNLLGDHVIGRLSISQDKSDAIKKRSVKGGHPAEDKMTAVGETSQQKGTDIWLDSQAHGFLDLDEALMPQMLRASFSKEFYLEQVHRPRHLKKPARFFEQPYLEVFTRTPWYIVPIVWLPTAIVIFFRSVTQFTFDLSGAPLDASKWYGPISMPIEVETSTWSIALAQSAICWVVGAVIWTLLEYSVHRFLFHVDKLLPDKPIFLALHFSLHGVHHYLPMDRLRLVMPPAVFLVLSYPFTQLAHVLFSNSVANGLISGSFSMYVAYDCMHYSLHHTKLPQYMREMKRYHLEHHYKNAERGFGVTSKAWDRIWGTQL